MASTENINGPRISLESSDRSPSPSPFSGKDHSKPHTSTSSLPEIPVPIADSTARRRRRSETQELKTKVELLGTKAAASGNVGGLTVILDSISSSDCDLINLRNEVGYNMLHYAVSYGHAKIVKLLLDRGADPDCITEDAMLETPLILAVKYSRKSKESLTILDLLLKQKVNVNWQNNGGDTALTLATETQHVAVFKRLIEVKNIEIEKANLKGDTPLIIAAGRDNIEILTILLTYKADIYAKNKLGHNAIHVACINGNIYLLQVILQKHKIEISRILRERDLQGNTPLLLAKTAFCNTPTLVEYLISMNADVRTSDHHGNKLLHLYNEIDDVDLCEVILNKCPQLLHDVNHDQETPLHIVTKLGYKYSAQLFIEKGADLFAEDGQHSTPFMVAIAAGQKDILRIMLDTALKVLHVTGQNASIVLWALENDHVTLLQAIWERDYQTLVDPEKLGTSLSLLHIAATFGAVESTKTMLAIPQTRVLLNGEDKKKRFPVHIAAEKGHLQVLTLLCEADAKVNIGDHAGNTPLHYACSNGHIQIVKYLMQNGSNPTSRNALEYDALACAAAEGHDNILQYLLSQGQSPNGTRKACPIILASAKGHIKCVKILLNRHDVNISKTNVVGYNCLAEAIRNGHKELTFAILSSKHWQVAMRMCTEDGITPMRLMIENMPDAAELVLYKCITIHSRDAHGHSTVSEIDYSYEFIEDFQDPREEWYYFRLSSLFTRKGHSYEPRHATMSAVESSVTAIRLTSRLNSTSGYTTTPTQTHVPKNRNNNWGPKKFEKKNHCIKLMVDNKRTQLLQHPLVAELLNYKWWIYGYPSFFFQLFVFIFFLAILTTFALLLPLPDDDSDCERLRIVTVNRSNSSVDSMNSTMINNMTMNMSSVDSIMNGTIISNMTMNTSSVDSIINGTMISNMSVNMSNITENNMTDGERMSCPGLPDLRRSQLRSLQSILYLLSVVGFIIEIVQLINQRLQYFLNLHSYLELLIYVSVILFIQVDADECYCADRTVWQLGAAACVLAWLNLVYILKRLPFTAIPINMMLNIIITFLSVVLLPILLIVTFALPFYMLLADPDRFTAFRTFGQSCVKTLVMITGEFEFDMVFLNDERSTIPYPVTTYILWIAFIILMPILFNNLLVGLAVGDIQKERDKAVLTKFYLQVDLALSVEELLTVIRRFWYKNSDTFHTTAKIPVKMFQTLFGTTFKQKSENIRGMERDENLRNHLMGVPDIDPLDEIKNLIEKQENDNSKLKAAVQAIQERSEAHDNMLQKILSTVENLTSGPSRFQSKSVKSMRLRLNKVQQDNSSSSNTLFPGNNSSVDDSTFPLLP